MPKDSDANSNSNESDREDSRLNPADSLPYGLPVSFWGPLVGAVGILIIVAVVHPSMVERIKFVTENALTVSLLFVVIAQAYIYRQQWHAMRDSVEKQEAALTQWIELRPHGITSSRRPSQPENERTIDLRWKIFNKTQLPFTIEMVQIAICRYKDWEKFEIEDEKVVPPSLSACNYYRFFIPVDLSADETEQFVTEGLELGVNGRITWTDAIGRQYIEPFGDFYYCTPHSLEVNESLGKSATFIGIEDGSDETDFEEIDKETITEFTVES